MSSVSSPTDQIFTTTRPWGDFQQFATNQEVTVKIITVQPGHRLSLQKHSERGELWHVLDAVIHVEVDGREWDAQPGEQVWVPRGAVHRMANDGDVQSRLLEIAFGRFDEADIERLHDDYVR